MFKFLYDKASCLQLATIAILPLLTMIWLSACQSGHEKTELLVSAAISLKDVLSELAAVFEKEHPNTRVVFNFAASGQLSQQISQGAPVDLFVSASVDHVDELAGKGLISPKSVQELAGNRLVVVALPGHRFSSISDLAKVDRLAIGNPKSVPAGAYARQALVKAKLYDSLASAAKLVLAENARQILAYVEGGDVDAGIVYNTDALLAEKSKVCFAIPQSDTKPMLYEIALLEKSSHKELAREFLAWVTSSQAKQAFQKRGFCP